MSCSATSQKQQSIVAAAPLAAAGSTTNEAPTTLPAQISTGQHLRTNQKIIIAPAPFPPKNSTTTTTTYIAIKSTLMIKNIDNSSNQTDCDEKEEEKELCMVAQRRESAPEDAISNASKLNTIEEHIATVGASEQPPLLETLPLSPAGAAAVATAVDPDPVASTATQSPPSESNGDSAAHQAEETANCADGDTPEHTASVVSVSRDQCFVEVDGVKAPELLTIASPTCTPAAAAVNFNAGSSNNNNIYINKTPSPKPSPRRKSSSSGSSKGTLSKTPSLTKLTSNLPIQSGRFEEDTVSKSSDTSGELFRGSPPTAADASSGEKAKSVSRLSQRVKKKSWYNVLYPNYKSRSLDFKKLFKEVPNDERLIVDYSCALQRDILVQGRLYVSQNYVCFHANIFRWETYLSIKWKDVTAINKEKTALVIPNAISICTAREKYFFATFTTRDKAFLMLFRVWQNTLCNKAILPQEMWQWVHDCYGDELGLTTDDEDYIDPTTTTVSTNETDGELEFCSALDDTQSVGLTSSDCNSYRTSISYIGCGSNSLNTNNATASGNSSSTGSGSGGGGGGAGGGIGDGGSAVKTKTPKTYFFNAKKSQLNSSGRNTSASGSDNKASDNNSGTDSRVQRAGRHSQTQAAGGKMKANAKELTLTSAKPDEGATTAAAASNANSGSGGVGSGGTGASPTAKESGKGGHTSASVGGAASTTTYDGKRKVAKNSRQRDESLSKNSENLPTDVSDSSDSDENKIPFVATAECSSTHEGRQLVHTILPINIETLFSMLFSSKSKFLVDFHAMRKSTDTSFGDWSTNDEGQQTRIVNVTVQLAASVGPKTSKVTEYQEMRECSKPGELYSIDINSVNAGIPYADSFSVLMHYCLVRTIDDHTMLSVHAQIKYKKSIWGVVKGFIEKNTWAGLEDFFTSLLHALQSETCIPPAKGKGRRPRRGTAAQIRPNEEVTPNAPTKSVEIVDGALITHGTLAPHLPPLLQSLPGEPPSKYKCLSLFVIVLLCFLLALNVTLLLKLWTLEARIDEDLSERARMPNLSALKQLPNTHQDWMELLREQEILHETELRRWHKVLQTAIELLKKVSTVCQVILRSDKLTQQIEQINDEL